MEDDALLREYQQEEKIAHERKQEVKSSAFNLSNITMVKKDQVTLNIRPDRSIESNKSKNNRQAGGSHR